MFGSSKPVVLSYGSSRAPKRRVPRWLILLTTGLGAGAGGLWFAQERLLPPRLTAGASNQLRSAFAQADTERSQLKTQLGSATQQLANAQSTAKRQAEELAAPRAEAQKLREDLAALVAALPADPRGGAVEVRTARFVAQGKELVYDVVLTHDKAPEGFNGAMQLSVLGLNARGAETTFTVKPVPVSVGAYALVRGRAAVPEGVRARRVTVQVLDATGSKQLGMRILPVQ
jgi:multidrug efflux pump subunit AcrA (membrane-fusion protein)